MVTSDDPLFYGKIHLSENDVPTLSSGSKVLNELEELSDKNEYLDTILYAPDETIKFFQKHFAELVESNEIGKLREEGFSSWKPNNNNIIVELDRNPNEIDGEGKDVYIGGPAALFSAAIQANEKENASSVLYGHDGMRGLSNWKGSASYFINRDAIPVYYWPDSSGIYTLYCTGKHFLQKKITPISYKKKFKEDPNFNKFRFDIKSFLVEEPFIYSKLFIKNAIKTVKDVNLHLTKTHLIKPSKSTAYVTIEHARLSRVIIPKISVEKQILMTSNETSKSLQLHFGEGLEELRNVFRNLKRIGGDTVKNYRLSKKEIEDRGYDSEFVQQALEFPNDGYLVPSTDQLLSKLIEINGGKVSNCMQLKKILVAPDGQGDCRATRIVWKNVENGQKYISPVKTLYLSLGPSVRKLIVSQPHYSLPSHVYDVVSNLFSPGSINEKNTYTPTFKSLMLHIANKVTSNNLMHETMWASGLSSTLLVKVDKSKVSASDMVKFRDHIDAHNKQCVRLAEKEAIIDGKPFQIFVLQMVGGGHFPNKDVHAEAAINVLKPNFIRLLNLNQEGIEFDIISARSCARGVCAENVFRMKAPLSNTVIIYGIGGIGITTMAPNALLMKAVLKLREDFSKGKIEATEFAQKMKESEFSSIPHWSWANPFTRNYSQFIDSCRDPREVARKLGISEPPCSNWSTINKLSLHHYVNKNVTTLNLFRLVRNLAQKILK